MSNQIAVIQDPVLASRGVLPSNLDAGTRDVVLVLAASIRNNHHQAARHVAQAGVMLVDLKNLINDDVAFKKFCASAFEWASPTTYRYLKIGASVKAHYVDADNLISPLVNNMASNIFLMLGADTDRAVIEKLNAAASELTFRTSRTQFGANFVASLAGEKRLQGRRVAREVAAANQ
jgi:hypothetical protein